MSDRIAVFNRGRIEQVGAPAEVYEKPATRFVAGFVGTSNLLTGEAARAIVGTPGTFTVRPEKIHLASPADEPADDEVAAAGRIREVVYVGPDTRYIVAARGGGRARGHGAEPAHDLDRGARAAGPRGAAHLEAAALPARRRRRCSIGGGTDRMKQPRILALAGVVALLAGRM